MGWVQWATVLALWGVVMSAVYMLRAYRAIFKGEPTALCAGTVDLRGSARVPAVLLLAALLVTGFFPNIVLKAVNPVVQAILSQ
jgi:NADH-quinone oxidoreductase subunit M